MEERTNGNALPISADHDRDAWLRWRKGGIGGSDAAAIMGQDKHRSNLDVYIDKTSILTSDERDNLLMRRGRELEPLAAARYVEVTGRQVRRQPVKVHRDFPFIRCTLDRQILAGDNNPTGLLQIKTAGAHTFRKMKMDGIPLKYWIQVQHELEVWDYDFGAIAVLQPDSWEFIHFDIDRDREFCARMIEAECAFWSLVESRTPPPSLQPAAEKMPDIGGDLVRVETLNEALVYQFQQIVDAYRVAQRIRDEANDFYDDVSGRLKLWMTSNDIDVVEGFGLRVYYREQDGRKSFDRKAAEAAYPEVDFARFDKRGQPFRSLRPFEMQKQLTEG